jgi:protein transport protein SEC24
MSLGGAPARPAAPPPGWQQQQPQPAYGAPPNGATPPGARPPVAPPPAAPRPGFAHGAAQPPQPPQAYAPAAPPGPSYGAPGYGAAPQPQQPGPSYGAPPPRPQQPQQPQPPGAGVGAPPPRPPPQSYPPGPPAPGAFGAAAPRPPPPGGPAPPAARPAYPAPPPQAYAQPPQQPLSPHGGLGAYPPPQQHAPAYPGAPPQQPAAYPGAPPQPPQQQHYAAPPSFGGAPPPRPPGAPGAAPAFAAPAPQAMAGVAGSRGVDPAQMPRPAAQPPPRQAFFTRRDNTHAAPPPAEAPLVATDAGSAPPRFMRASLNAVPAGPDLLRACGVPFAVVIAPLAPEGPDEAPVPLVDGGPAGPLRCSACGAYVCAHMRWPEGGRQMACGFCGGLTAVPPEYHCHVDLDGRRRDAGERPELCRGSVEFAVDAAPAYSARPPPPPTLLFLIDVTAGAVASGLTAAACAAAAAVVADLPADGGARAGVAAFDGALHWWAPRPPGAAAGGAPRELVVPEVEEPFCPLPPAAVAPPLAGGGAAALAARLAALPAAFGAGAPPGAAPPGDAESAGGAALRAGVEALAAAGGGRLVAFLGSRPARGAGALRPREAGRPPAEKDPLEMMLPQGRFYSDLAAAAAAAQVSVDLFAAGPGHADLATLSALPSRTGGALRRYHPFSFAADAARLAADVRAAAAPRGAGLEALGRLRASAGVVVEEYLGALERRPVPEEVAFAALRPDAAVVARLGVEGRLREGGEALLQFALLYTAAGAPPGARRRVRVHTLALPVTRSVGTAFRGADLDAVLAVLARGAAAGMPGRSLAASREGVTAAVVAVLAAYRRHCAGAGSSGQLILPESLKLLPLHALALTKAPLFRTDARADARAAWATRLAAAPADRLAAALLPRLLALHDLAERPAGAPVLPDRLPLTGERLDPAGIYLLENGLDAFIWVGGAAAPAAVAALFGSAAPLEGAPLPGGELPDTGAPLNRAARAVLAEVSRQRRAFLRLRPVRRGHPSEPAFLAALLEDRAPAAGGSYVEYLCLLHRQIQNRATG